MEDLNDVYYKLIHGLLTYL